MIYTKYYLKQSNILGPKIEFYSTIIIIIFTITILFIIILSLQAKIVCLFSEIVADVKIVCFS